MAVLEDLRMKTGELLDEGLNTGALTVSEHSWRRGHLTQADSVEALESLVEDLLVPASPNSALPPTSFQMTMFSNRTYGQYDMGRRFELVTIMGSTNIDLKDFAPTEHLNIELVTVMGETTITIPDGMQVRFECERVMADSHIAPSLLSPQGTLHITGAVVMGSLRVVTAQRTLHG